MTIKEYNRSVDEYSDIIFRFLVKNTNNRELSSDIVQDVFLKLWQKRMTVRYDGCKNYLFKMAYNRMIDCIRREKNNALIDDFSFQDETRYNEVDTKSIIDEALGRLPEIQKAAITLRDYEGYSYDEIGKILNLTESQVKVYIYRGRKSMKNYLVRIENVI